ncbi:MAG: hypothetical protein Q9176_002979 [Flavoplaca citrina]
MLRASITLSIYPTSDDQPSSSSNKASAEPYEVEQDPRWRACDEFQFPHLNPPSRPYYKSIQHALDNSLAKGLADISVAPSQGKFFWHFGRLFDHMDGKLQPRRKSSHSRDRPRIAEINIRYAGLNDRIELLVGAAADLLPQLVDDVKQGRRPQFDFSFIDADKDNALHCFNWCKAASRKRGVVYIDNVIRKGLLADKEMAKTDGRVKGVRTAIEGIGKDDSVDAVVLQTVDVKNYDGFLMAIIK